MAHDSDRPGENSPTGRPLDQFVPGLRRKADRLPALPVHPRVVHVRDAVGDRRIVLASFAPPASVKAFHAALKPQIEAALLAELSRPGRELAEDASRLVGLELYLYHGEERDYADMLSLFGLTLAPLDEPAAHSALALLRRELQSVDGHLPEEPVARYRARFVSSAHPLYARLVRGMRELAPRDAWGERPGALARACADQLSSFGYLTVEPTREGIERLEAVLISEEPGVVRWIEPQLFQALCDLVAVSATVTFERPVQWGVCEPDQETQLAPPPLLLAERDGESFHVPLGEHVLGWCVMPRFPSESIPTLGAWAEHEFT